MTKEIEAIRNEVILESRWICCVCHQAIGQIHHLDENHDNNVKDNLVCLCTPCHRKFHSNSDFDLQLNADRIRAFRELWRKDAERIAPENIELFKAIAGVPVDGEAAVLGKSKIANTYWLGFDLMKLVYILLGQGSPEMICFQIKQSKYHMTTLGLKGFAPHTQVEQLYDEIHKVTEWDDTQRIVFAGRAYRVATFTGSLLEMGQPLFDDGREDERKAMIQYGPVGSHGPSIAPHDLTGPTGPSYTCATTPIGQDLTGDAGPRAENSIYLQITEKTAKTEIRQFGS